MGIIERVEEALVARQSAEFDLMMPEINGITLIQTLRTLDQQTPAIAISAWVYGQDILAKRGPRASCLYMH